MRSHIFISYARRDEQVAEGLAEALRRQGWTVWWDALLRVAEAFSEGIEAALNEARCVVVLWSSTSVKSEWVMREALAGKQRGVLVPVMIEDGLLIPRPFDHLQAARLRGWDGRRGHPAFRRLVEAITRVAGPGYALASEPLEFMKVLEIPGASGLTGAFGSLWVSTEERSGLVRLDRAVGQEIAKIPVGRAWGVIAGAGHVWTLSGRGVARVDPRTNEVSGKLELGPFRGGVDRAWLTERVLWVMGLPQWQVPEIYAVAAGAETLVEFGPFIEVNPVPGPFKLPGDRLLVRTADRQSIHILSGPPPTVERTISTGEVSFGHKSADSLWWNVPDDTTYWRLDLRTLGMTSVELTSGCRILWEVDDTAYVEILDGSSRTTRITQIDLSGGGMEVLHTFRGVLLNSLVGGGFLWVEAYPPRVIQIDLESRSLAGEIQLNGAVSKWRFHRGALWVRQTGQLARIDPATSRVNAAISGTPESGFYFDDEEIWMLREKELWRWGLAGMK